MTSSEDPLRRLLEVLAEESDRMSRHLDRLYEELFIGSAADPRLSLLVDDASWERVSDFDRSGPDDRHYVVGLGEDSGATIRFGDGERGLRPPAGAQLELTYERGKRRIVLLVAPDRLTLNVPAREPHADRVYGIQRAVVVDGHDPEHRGRLLVQVPRVTGQASVWATPCFAPSDRKAQLVEGDGCWVLYEDGDVDRPVWLGEPEPEP